MRHSWFALSVFAVSSLGCVTSAVRTRAAADFGCPEENIEVVHLPGRAYRASGCHQFATYVCASDICVMNGPNSFDAPPASPPPSSPAPAATAAATATSEPPAKKGVVAHDGVAFDLPEGFWRDEDAKGEVYRDGKRHHAARLTISTASDTEAEWIASHYPTAKSWTAKVGEQSLTFATQLGSKLRVTVAVIASSGRVYELACSSDDVESEKTDAVCTKLLTSFRLKKDEGGLPGE